MRNNSKRSVKRPNEAGYTLTEMLVVIGIIALIAAVLTPGLLGQMGRARAKAAQTQVQTVATAVETFHSDVGRYPTTAEGLAVLVGAPDGLDGWVGPYVKDNKMLKDPWGNDLVYQSDNSGRAYTVTSRGADGAAGGSGVNRDIVEPSA